MRARISDGSDPLTVQPPIRSKRMIQPVRNCTLRSVRGNAKGRNRTPPWPVASSGDSSR